MISAGDGTPDRLAAVCFRGSCWSARRKPRVRHGAAAGRRDSGQLVRAGARGHVCRPPAVAVLGLSGLVRKFAWGHAASAWGWFMSWASMRCSRLSRSVRVNFQLNGLAMML